MILKKPIYKILCKEATGGKEAYTMLQEYVMENILNKTENMLDVNEDAIFDNVFYTFEKIKVRNEKQANIMLNKIIDEELSSLNI